MAELRRWSIEGYGVRREKGIDGYVIILSGKNTGLSPALNARIALSASLDSGEPGIFPVTSEERFRNSYVLGPSTVFGCGQVGFSSQRIACAREDPILIEIEMKYDTIFPNIIDRTSKIILRFQYVGKAGLSEIEAGLIDGGNFLVSPVGGSGIMT